MSKVVRRWCAAANGVFLAVALASGCQDSGTGGLDPGLFNSCSSLVNNSAVQAAIAELNAAGLAFPVYSETTPPNVEGGWDIVAGAVTRDSTGSVNFPLPSGRDTLFDQMADRTLSWMTVRGGTISAFSQRGFIAGTAQRFSVCLLIQVTERDASNTVTLCARQMAFFYSLVPNGDGGELSGNFLAVTLAVTGGGGTNCLETGEFVYGTITLREAPAVDSAPVLASLGTVPLGTRTPTSVVMLPNGTGGFVGTSQGAVLFFDVATRTTTELVLPTPNAFASAGPVRVSPDGGRVGFVETGDSRILVYGTTSRNLVANIVPPTSPSPAAFAALPTLFPTAGNAAAAGITYQNHRPGFAFFNSVQGGSPAGIGSASRFLNDNLRTILATPNGTQLVAVLGGGALPGLARFVGFMSAATGTVQAEVDLTSPIGRDVLDDVIAASTDSARVWVTTGDRIYTISTSQFGLTGFDVLENTADEIRNFAPSPDGQVWLVSIASSNGRGNLAVVDNGTLALLHRRFLASLDVNPTEGRVLFIPGTRIAVIASGPGGIDIVPINTLSPYAAGTAAQAALATTTANSVDLAAGGRVLAVANAAERSVYLFQLVSP